ncbi:MAG: galactokinase [Demequina sp.]
MTDHHADAHGVFTAAYGYEPEGLWSAPGRVNLIGEHTDYNDGLVLPFAIDRRTWCAAAARDDRTVRVTSALTRETVECDLRALDPDQLSGWSAYVLGVVWAFGEHGVDLTSQHGVDLALTSNVPLGAGLSSSAAIECSVAAMLNDMWDLSFERSALARVGQLAENRAVGAPTGIMDQMASLMGEHGHAVFLDCQDLSTALVPLDLARHSLTALIIDTRVKHSHANGGYADRRASCERGAHALNVPSLRHLSIDHLPQAQTLLDNETFRRVRHVVTENARVADTVATLNESGPLSIGLLLDASHASMRDDFEISVPELDTAVQAARDTGAIGARMTGGGFGGAAVALVDTQCVDEVSAAVTAAFARHAFESPDIFAVLPGDGARRES